MRLSAFPTPDRGAPDTPPPGTAPLAAPILVLWLSSTTNWIPFAQHRVLAQAPHHGGHAVVQLAVDPRLRAIGVVGHLDQLRGRRGQAQIDELAAERAQRVRPPRRSGPRRPSPALTPSVWPSRTLTRLQVRGDRRSRAARSGRPRGAPRIFAVSRCDLRPPPSGCRGSRCRGCRGRATPGLRPAPESACIEVMITERRPKRRASGASATTRPVVGAVRDRHHEALPAALALLALHEHGVLEVHAGDQDRDVVLVAERRRGRDHRHAAARSAPRARAPRRSRRPRRRGRAARIERRRRRPPAATRTPRAAAPRRPSAAGRSAR